MMWTYSNSNTKYGAKDYVCDTEADIKDIPLMAAAAGSTLFVIETSNQYILTSDGTWKLIQSGGHGGGDGGSYTLPIANEHTLGGIKESDTIVIDDYTGVAHAVIGDSYFETDEDFGKKLDAIFNDK